MMDRLSNILLKFDNATLGLITLYHEVRMDNRFGVIFLL